jgi:AcrR family transcriptional regulator
VVQRARLLSAAARVVAELGYGGMSVARVCAGAGVSRRTFYEQFEDREHCFLALFDDALARATLFAQAAVVEGSGWRERVRAGLCALLLFVSEEPALGSLLVVEALGGGPKVLERRAQTLDVLRGIVDEGRAQARVGQKPPPLTAEGVVGAVLSVLHARLLERDTADPATNGSSRASSSSSSLIGLLNPLMGMIVLPYLGRAAAARELARAVPRRPARVSGALRAPRAMVPSDPLDGLEMRLTYRTLRVLSAIASQPGASNRQVGEAAGVHDQGQISKLLARLERLGLIHNAGQGQPRGERNAWTLTTRGTEVQAALGT